MPKTLKLVIYLDTTGGTTTVKVRCKTPADCAKSSHPEAWTGRRVEWEAEQAGDMWVVLFKGANGSPLASNRYIVASESGNPKGEVIASGIDDETQFSYSVVLQRGDHVYAADPIIAVRDSGGVAPRTLLSTHFEQAADLHDTVADATAELATLERDLAQALAASDSEGPADAV